MEQDADDRSEEKRDAKANHVFMEDVIEPGRKEALAPTASRLDDNSKERREKAASGSSSNISNMATNRSSGM